MLRRDELFLFPYHHQSDRANAEMQPFAAYYQAQRRRFLLLVLWPLFALLLISIYVTVWVHVNERVPIKKTSIPMTAIGSVTKTK